MSLPDLAPRQNQLRDRFRGAGLRIGRSAALPVPSSKAPTPTGARRPSSARSTMPAWRPGRYTFLVRAVERGRRRERTTRDRHVHDSAPVLAALVVRDAGRAGAGARGVMRLYRYRVARLLEIANMRTRIATDLHDDIGANLTRIAMLSEVARQTPASRSPAVVHRPHRPRVGRAR